jgi:PEP-CTERM motif
MWLFHHFRSHGFLGRSYRNGDGVKLVDSSFTFQLGSFNDGYDPLASPVSNWAANWHTFDTAIYNDTTMFFSSVVNYNELGISDGLNADTTYNFSDKLLYLWIFNTNTFNPLTPTTNEFALFTGNWILHNDVGCGCGEDNLPQEFFVSNITSAFTGSVDPDYTGTGSPIIGPIGTATQPPGVYDLQTHSITVIPEPSAFMLSLLGIFGLVLRRKRGI